MNHLPSSSPTGISTASLPPLPPSATLPVHRVAREIGLSIQMAPAPGGALFISIPRQGGSVLALLDRIGQPRPGWPIAVENSTACELLLPVDDGSVRVQCDATDAPQFDLSGPEYVRAFAFDADGRSKAGWPVQLQPGYGGRVVGDELRVFADHWLTDTVTTGQVSHERSLTTVAADGRLNSGTKVPMVETCCGETWAVGPAGVAYGVASVGEWDFGSPEVSEISALDPTGTRAGWPVTIDGIASGPAFGPADQIVVTVGSFVRKTSRVLAFQGEGRSAAAVSAGIPIATAEWGVDCIAGAPRVPIVAQDGTIFVYSEIETAVYALDQSLKVMPGWPYRPDTGLVEREMEVEPGTLSCGAMGAPAAGPDGTLYLPLEARDATVGGSIVAVGSDGRVRPGWPVELRRQGSEFWSVVVGFDGTVHALAVEPEPGGKSSASIVGFAPDSTLLYSTTIVDP